MVRLTLKRTVQASHEMWWPMKEVRKVMVDRSCGVRLAYVPLHTSTRRRDVTINQPRVSQLDMERGQRAELTLEWIDGVM